MASVDADAMARMRTAMAADRTLMAWVRTALSMISFGFTITKFFQFLQEGGRTLERPHAARNLGLTLAALGVVGVVAAVFHHWKLLGNLGPPESEERWSITTITAIVVAVIGVGVFVSALTQAGPF